MQDELGKFIEWQDEKINPLIDQYYTDKVSAADPMMGLILSFARRLVIRGTDPDDLLNVFQETVQDQASRIKQERH